MQWSNEPHGGFTTAEKPVAPVIESGPYGYEHLNVAAQRRDPNSFLNWLERVCRMRKEVPEIGRGDFEVLDLGIKGVLALRHEWRNNAVLVLHNLADRPCEVKVPAQTSHGRGGLLVNLLSEDHGVAEDDGRFGVLLESYGYRWFRVGGLDYLLQRSETDD